MESKKVLSAGCSFIYGAELSDSPDIMGSTPPSVKTWPALYAKSKGLEYHTCAVCGLSNQGIVRYVIDVVENFKVDYVIVQWTFPNRYELRLNELKNNSFYYCLTYWLSQDLKTDNPIVNQLKDSEKQYLKELVSLWYRHVDNSESSLYYMLKSKIELANYLRYKNLPFVFTSAETITLPNTDDKSLKTLINLNNSLPEIHFNEKGFYRWAQDEKYVFGEQHPLDDAHYSAFNLIKSQIDKHLFNE